MFQTINIPVSTAQPAVCEYFQSRHGHFLQKAQEENGRNWNFDRRMLCMLQVINQYSNQRKS